VTFTDDKLRYMKIACIARKSDALKMVIAEMKTETSKSVKRLRTDGGEYVAE
jgi:hypothetical protein